MGGQLRGDRPDLDAVIWAAETGSAWTLIYPSYSVAVPRGLGIRVPGAYALPRGQGELRIFINRWLDLKLGDGTTQALFDHWILGKNVETRGPRWSILHDVLGWGKEAEGEPGAPASPYAPSGQETVTESDENTEET